MRTATVERDTNARHVSVEDIAWSMMVSLDEILADETEVVIAGNIAAGEPGFILPADLDTRTIADPAQPGRTTSLSYLICTTGGGLFRISVADARHEWDELLADAWTASERRG